jgi:hypothetical protein
MITTKINGANIEFFSLCKNIFFNNRTLYSSAPLFSRPLAFAFKTFFNDEQIFKFALLSHRALAACLQRHSGLAQWRLTQMVMRAANVQFRNSFSAGLVPPLRQTA